MALGSSCGLGSQYLVPGGAVGLRCGGNLGPGEGAGIVRALLGFLVGVEEEEILSCGHAQ